MSWFSPHRRLRAAARQGLASADVRTGQLDQRLRRLWRASSGARAAMRSSSVMRRHRVARGDPLGELALALAGPERAAVPAVPRLNFDPRADALPRAIGIAITDVMARDAVDVRKVLVRLESGPSA